MEQTQANNVPAEVDDFDRYYVPTDSSTVETNADGSPDLNHDFYRFAYDLAEQVLNLREQLNRNVTHNLPEPTNYLFTKDHANTIQILLANDGPHYNRAIWDVTNGVFDFNTYLACRNYFVSSWQTTPFTEKSFISACASIAYVAAYFIQLNHFCGALDDAVGFIANWIKKVMRQGTITHSRW